MFLNALLKSIIYTHMSRWSKAYKPTNWTFHCCSHINLPVLPQGLRIMADKGFANVSPLLLPVRAGRQALPKRMRRWMKFLSIKHNMCKKSGLIILDIKNHFRSFRRVRSLIERCFGCLKTSYVSVGTRRFRSRRWILPVICNLTAGLYNRRRLLFKRMRDFFDTD